MNNDKNNKNTNLWLTFELKEHIYAVNADYVNGIWIKPEEITPIPNSAPYVDGLIDYLGAGMITLVNLRELFNFPSLKSELEEFKGMLEQRKIDHENWVKALEDSVVNNTEFKLATDPHQCAFGKWYYNYEPVSTAVEFQMKKIDEPHRLLHETALEIERVNTLFTENKEHELTKLLRKASKQLMPKVLRLIDGTIDAFEEAHREMLIVLTNNNGKDGIAIIVDEVLKVEPLELFTEDYKELIYHNEYVNGVAKRHNEETLILTIDAETIVKMAGKETGKN